MLDAINTPPAQQAEVNAQVVKHLAFAAPESRIALYRLGSRVEILHDFTEDIASLRARIARNAVRLQPSSVDRGGDVDGLAKDADADKRQLVAEVAADLHVRRQQTIAFTDLDVAIAEKNEGGVFCIRHEPATLRIEAAATGRLQPLLQFAKQWELDKRAALVRLIIRDRLTARYGVLDVPLRQVPQA